MVRCWCISDALRHKRYGHLAFILAIPVPSISDTQAERDFWIRVLQDASKLSSQGASASESSGDYVLTERRNRSGRLKKIGDYMLGELIGEGGYAKVKSGFSVKTGERVAAKIMLNSEVKENQREIEGMFALKVCASRSGPSALLQSYVLLLRSTAILWSSWT